MGDGCSTGGSSSLEGSAASSFLRFRDLVVEVVELEVAGAAGVSFSEDFLGLLDNEAFTAVILAMVKEVGVCNQKFDAVRLLPPINREWPLYLTLKIRIYCLGRRRCRGRSYLAMMKTNQQPVR